MVLRWGVIEVAPMAEKMVASMDVPMAASTAMQMVALMAL